MDPRVELELQIIRNGGWPRFTPAGIPVPAFCARLTESERDKGRFRDQLKIMKASRMVDMVLFALEAENRRDPISTIDRLIAMVEVVCSKDYDLTPARALRDAFREAHRLSYSAAQLVTDDMRDRYDGGRIFDRELQAKRLPVGKEANLPIIRTLVKIKNQESK